IDEPERMRLVAGRDQPKLQRFLLLAEKRSGNDGEARFAGVDGGDEARLPAIGVEPGDERRTRRSDRADIDQRGEARGGERARAEGEATPEAQAPPQPDRPGTTGIADLILDARPQAARRRNLGHRGGKSAEPLFPERDFTGEGRVAADPALGGAALRGV